MMMMMIPTDAPGSPPRVGLGIKKSRRTITLIKPRTRRNEDTLSVPSLPEFFQHDRAPACPNTNYRSSRRTSPSTCFFGGITWSTCGTPEIRNLFPRSPTKSLASMSEAVALDFIGRPPEASVGQRPDLSAASVTSRDLCPGQQNASPSRSCPICGDLW